MPVLEILAVAAALGADAMSVCMGIGVRWHGRRQKFRLAWHMGLFQFLMPIIGWAIGEQLAGLLTSVGRYVAALAVFAVGAKMLYEAVKSRPGKLAQEIEGAVENAARRLHVEAKDPTRGWSLLILSVATSVDALVVGFSLGLRDRQMNILFAAAAIGVVAAGMALAGVIIGKRVGQAIGRPAEMLGGAVLIGLGLLFALKP